MSAQFIHGTGYVFLPATGRRAGVQLPPAMPTVARVVLPGYPCHVSHRGDRRENLFFSSEDCDVYRKWRFYSTVLDADYLWTAVRYVETNPVRAGLVTQAEAHPWSSARAPTTNGPSSCAPAPTPAAPAAANASSPACNAT